MKNKFFTASLLLFTISSSLIGTPTNTEITGKNTEAARVRAKSKASAPSSSKQEPFKKLDKKKLTNKSSLSKKAVTTKHVSTNTVATRQKASKHSASSHAHAHDRFDRFDRIDANFASMFESIQKEMDTLSDMVQSVKKSSCASCNHTNHNNNKITSYTKSIDAQYSIKDAITQDVNGQNLYELTIGMPGYTSDDITVKFHQTKNKEKSGKTLEIHAKKQVNQEETNVATKSSQQFMSTSIINGKKQELSYKDGILKIKLDLPNDVSDEYYTMSLENNMLKICLPKNSVNNTTKVLEFKKSNVA